MTETKISDFHTSLYIPAIQKSTFTYHMCAYLVQISVAKYNAQPSNDGNYFKMFFVAVIMLRGQQQVLLIKYNLSIMVEIDLCLYKVLHWKISVQHHRQISIHLHFHVHGMQYFIIYYLTIANRMLPLLLQTSNI